MPMPTLKFGVDVQGHCVVCCTSTRPRTKGIPLPEVPELIVHSTVVCVPSRVRCMNDVYIKQWTRDGISLFRMFVDRNQPAESAQDNEV
jgi:hypothetical protein